MIRLAYISTLSASTDGSARTRTLVKIMSQARVFNKSRGVSGILIVSGGSCLQVLEGDSAELAQLMYKIRKDSRHHHVEVIYKIPVNQRLFESWSMRLLSKGTPAFSESMDKLYRSDKEIRAARSGPLSERLSKFFSGVSLSTPQGVNSELSHCDLTEKNYTGKHLTIRRWPKSRELQITSKTARLCSILSGAGASYEALCSKSIYSDTNRLTECLDALDLVGLLNAKSGGNYSNQKLAYAGAMAKKSPDRFSQMLRNFISTAGK